MSAAAEDTAPAGEAGAVDAPPETFGVSIVCTGNICRSPMAEVLLREHIERNGWTERVWVESAGTMNWHTGKGADPRTLDVLAQHGYDGSAHRAREFRMVDLAHLDLVLVTDEGNLRLLRMRAYSPERKAKVQLLRSFDPAAVAAGTLSVDDPYHGGPDGFERTFQQISAAMDGVARHIAQQLPLP